MKRSARDLTLDNHSADLANFRATADSKSSSALKFAKNKQSTTATPRILEEYDRTLCEKSAASKKWILVKARILQPTRFQDLRWGCGSFAAYGKG